MAHEIEKYWKKLNENKVQCELCPRLCIISEDKRGFCHVRGNIDGKMVLLTYGHNSGLSIDPIEKKPLRNFLQNTTTLSFGTLGCNMGCLFCQNFHLSKSKCDPNSMHQAKPEEIVQIALDHNCPSISFTYNDPIIFFEYARDVALLAHKNKIKTVAVTAGFINESPREEFFSFIDATNVDLKSFSDSFYKKFCNASIEPVLHTLKYIKHQTKTHLEITNLLIEGENDSISELNEMAQWIASELGKDTPLHFIPFRPMYKMANHPMTSYDTLIRAREIAKKNGLEYVY